MKEQIISNLTSKKDTFACAFAEKILSKSRETDEWYKYFFDFAALLDHLPWRTFWRSGASSEKYWRAAKVFSPCAKMLTVIPLVRLPEGLIQSTFGTVQKPKGQAPGSRLTWQRHTPTV